VTLTPPLDLITTAVLGLLRTGGRTVWDAVYGGSATTPGFPYDILYPLLGGDSNPMPTLDDRNDTVTVPYQVTSVSNLRNQAQRQARVARDLLIGRAPSGGYATPLLMPDGWTCVHRAPDPVMPGVDRAGDNPNAIFTAPARYLLTIAPA
jgi:hypothetical protein